MITFEFVIRQALCLLVSAAKKTTQFKQVLTVHSYIAGEKGPQSVFVTWLQNGLMHVYSATQELVCAYLPIF